jgi:hypothetical protein
MTDPEPLDLDAIGAERRQLEARLEELRGLTASAVRQERDHGGEGTTYEQLAARAGVTKETVRQILVPGARATANSNRRRTADPGVAAITGQKPVPQRKQPDSRTRRGGAS